MACVVVPTSMFSPTLGLDTGCSLTSSREVARGHSGPEVAGSDMKYDCSSAPKRKSRSDSGSIRFSMFSRLNQEGSITKLLSDRESGKGSSPSLTATNDACRRCSKERQAASADDDSRSPRSPFPAKVVVAVAVAVAVAAAAAPTCTSTDWLSMSVAICCSSKQIPKAGQRQRQGENVGRG